jgi:hypothetical protein
MSGASMEGEGFLHRWARLKSTADAGTAPPAAPAAAPAADPPTAAPIVQPDEAQARPPPTLEDVERLTADSDYSAFVSTGADKDLQRLALKKLFADPHFHVMDGLDIYMADFNQPSPMSLAMLASLQHAPDILGRLFGDKEKEADDEPAPADGAATQAEQETPPQPPYQGNA